MIDKPVAAAAPPAFSPLARAVIDTVGEGIVVFDSQGRVLFANSAARRVIDGQNGDVRNRLQTTDRRRSLHGSIRKLVAAECRLDHPLYTQLRHWRGKTDSDVAVQLSDDRIAEDRVS